MRHLDGHRGGGVFRVGVVIRYVHVIFAPWGRRATQARALRRIQCRRQDSRSSSLERRVENFDVKIPYYIDETKDFTYQADAFSQGCRAAEKWAERMGWMGASWGSHQSGTQTRRAPRQDQPSCTLKTVVRWCQSSSCGATAVVLQWWIPVERGDFRETGELF